MTQCPACRGTGTIPAAAARYVRPVHFLLSNLRAGCDDEQEGDRFSAIPGEVTCPRCIAAMVCDD